MALHPCPTCERHVRDTESRCPFCASALPEAFGAARQAAPLSGRLTRAAILFASATTIAGCGGETDTGGASSGASSSGSSGSGTSSGTSGSGTSSGTSGEPVALYGPAPVDDGGSDGPTIDAGADAGKDAGVDKKDGGPVALYGPAPIDAG